MLFSPTLPLLALALLIGTTVSAGAAPIPNGMTTVPLAAITNDRDATVSHFKLIVGDDAAARGIYLDTSANADSPPLETSGQVYWSDAIASDEGVVLGQGQGVKAVFLQGTLESEGEQDSLVIRYLTNGVFMKYAECRVGIQRMSPDGWQLVNAYDGRPIKQIQVRTWMLGISTLENVCPMA